MTEQKRTLLNKVYYYGPNVLTLTHIVKDVAKIAFILVATVVIATL